MATPPPKPPHTNSSEPPTPPPCKPAAPCSRWARPDRPTTCSASARGAPGAWSLAMGAFERTAESFVGVVAHPPGDGRDAEPAGREQVAGEMHPPAGEVADRRGAGHVAATLVEQRWGYGSPLGQAGDGPLPVGLGVDQRHDRREHRVAERPRPAAVDGGGALQM